MQSSTLVMIRAVIMLAFLIAIPLVAVFGVSLPDVVRAVIDGKAATMQRSANPAPLTAGAKGPLRAGAPAAGASADASPFAAPPATAQPNAAPQTLDAEAHASLRGQVRPVAAWEPVAAPSGSPGQSLTAYETAASQPVEHAAAMNFEVGAPTTAPPGGSESDFARLERRLQQLGAATYYRLESWGSDGQMYRFYCMMQLFDDPSQNRHFQATAATAEAAMQQVLQEVEAWRLGPRP